MKEQAGAFVRGGANQPRVGDFNQTVIVEAIRRSEGGLSRVGLAAATGLAPQTVSNICRRLIDLDLVVESGKIGGGRGKPRTILQLNPAGRYAVGVHLDPAVITFVVMDLTGVVTSSRTVTPPETDPDETIAVIASAIDDLITRSDVDRGRILGAGIAAPGPIDLVRGTIVDPPNLARWHRVPLRDALEAATGLSVLLEKDVTAAAVAEMWAGGPRETGTFLVVYLGRGVGAGLVLRGEVVRGVSGNAGELGHIVTDPDGPHCPCGLRGCVAVTVTVQALVTEAIETGVLDPSATFASVDVAFEELCHLANAGLGPARDIVDRSAVRMSRAVAVMANLFDVDRVVFGGPHWTRLAPIYLDRIPALLDSEVTARAIHRVEVVGTSVGENLGAVGAASLVFDQTFSPHPATLVLTPDTA